MNLLSFIYRLRLVSILSWILAGRSIRATSWCTRSLRCLVRLRDRRAIEWTRIEVSQLNHLILTISTCLNGAYRGLADVNLVLRKLNQLVQELLRMLPLIHVILVENLIHQNLLVLLLPIHCRHRCNFVKEPMKKNIYYTSSLTFMYP